jgi:hypothetical protein
MAKAGNHLRTVEAETKGEISEGAAAAAAVGGEGIFGGNRHFGAEPKPYSREREDAESTGVG